MQSFLSLCQGNHYQFDTLRRAKHSSMMVLYHLHNPDAPAFSSTCNVCTTDIEPGQGYRCSVCTDFDICANCYQLNNHGHPHQLHVWPCGCASRLAARHSSRAVLLIAFRLMEEIEHQALCWWRCRLPDDHAGMSTPGLHVLTDIC